MPLIGLLMLGCGAGPGGPLGRVPTPSADTCMAWSDPSTWPDGVVPGVGASAGACVTVPADECVRLDLDHIDLAYLQVDGALEVADVHDVVIRADRVVVQGHLIVGTEAAPFTHRARVELSGGRTRTVPYEGGHRQWGWASECSAGPLLRRPETPARTLLVRDGGVLDLHGAMAGPAWTRLASPAGPDAADPHRLDLQDPVAWAVGDSVLVTSTHEDPSQAEVHLIAAVDGATVWTEAPLEHAHSGVRVRADADPAGLGVPVFAEVANLTRRIEVVGVDVEAGEIEGRCAIGVVDCTEMACPSPPDPPTGLVFHGAEIRVEGHATDARTPQVRIDGVAVRNGGKYGQLGHYPVHLHELGHVVDSHVRRSVVWESANRAFVLHGTSQLLLEDNIALEVVGHAYYLEPSEVGHRTHDNLLARNLGAGVHACNPLDDQSGVSGPAAFYAQDPENTWVDNVAAGSDYAGFYLGTRAGDPCTAAGDPAGCKATFVGNTAHSSRTGFWSDETKDITTEVVDFTAFSVSGRAVWTHNRGLTTVTGLRTADVGIGVYFASQAFQTRDPLSILSDSLLVGVSGIAPPTFLARSDTGEASPRLGVELYEGRIGVVDTVFADFPPATDGTPPTAAIGRHQNLVFYDNDPLNHVAGITLVDAEPLWFGAPVKDSLGTATIAVYDLDGSLTGAADAWAVAPHPLFDVGEPMPELGATLLTRDRGELVQLFIEWTDPVLEAESGRSQVERMDIAGVAGSQLHTRMRGQLARDARNNQGANLISGGDYRIFYAGADGEALPGFDALRVVLRAGPPGSTVRLQIPVPHGWDGSVSQRSAFADPEPGEPVPLADSAVDVAPGSYWFDPHTSVITLAPVLPGDGDDPFAGEMVILDIAP